MAKDQPPTDDYEVGYGKPPKGSQFPFQQRKKVGRPLGSKNKPKPGDLTPSERAALVESQRIVQPGTKLTATAAVERAQIKTAVTGGTMAQKAHLARIAQLEQKERDATDKRLNSWEEYVRTYEFLLDRADPEHREFLEQHMIPHPADVEVDFVKREVRILGPASSLEARICAETLSWLAEAREMAMQWRTEIESDPTNWSLQADYIRLVGGCADLRELLPDRLRPPMLSSWAAASTFPWWYEASSGYVSKAASSTRKTRRRGTSTAAGRGPST